jgi:hypothetical protein
MKSPSTYREFLRSQVHSEESGSDSKLYDFIRLEHFLSWYLIGVSRNCADHSGRGGPFYLLGV